MSITGSSSINGNGKIVFFTIPSAPTNLTASNVTSSSAIIGFTPPPISSVTGYYAYNNGALLGTFVGTNSINLTGLIATTSYVITLIAYNSYGQSPMSSSINLTTAPTVISRCKVFFNGVSSQLNTSYTQASPFNDVLLNSHLYNKHIQNGTDRTYSLSSYGTKYGFYCSDTTNSTQFISSFSSNVNINNGFAFSCFVCMLGLGGGFMGITLNNGNFIQLIEYPYGGSGVRFYCNNTTIGGTFGPYNTIGTTVLQNKTWYHLLVSAEYKTNYYKITYYINGVLDNTTNDNTYTPNSGINSVTGILCNAPNNSYGLYGYINKIRIFDTFLSASDASYIFNYDNVW